MEKFEKRDVPSPDEALEQLILSVRGYCTNGFEVIVAMGQAGGESFCVGANATHPVDPAPLLLVSLIECVNNGISNKNSTVQLMLGALNALGIPVVYEDETTGALSTSLPTGSEIVDGKKLRSH